MKKILTVSLVAMMAVSAARAEIASKAYVDQQDGQLSQLTTTAKNNLVAAINEVDADVATLNGSASTEGSVAKQIADAVAGIGTAGTYVTSNEAITGATHTKITYDAKGLVTAGDDLAASDIPDLTLSKITDAGTAAALNVSTGVGAAGVTDGGTGLVTGDQVYEYVAANAGAANFIEDQVTDGTTNKAPSSNAVYDQLALKEDVISSTNKVDVAFIDDTNYATSDLKTTLDAAYDASGAATSAVNALTYAGASGGNVITQVTQTNGAVSATMGTAIMKTDTINENGTYVLTATRSGTEGNYTYTYQWENITRATPAQQGGGN